MLLKHPTRIALLALTLLLSLATSAQETATIYGRISDSTGAPLEDVIIAINGSSQDPTFTDAKGKFEYSIPANKSVSVVFSRTGYNPVIKKIQAAPNERVRYNASLKLSKESQLPSIKVTDEKRNLPIERIPTKDISKIPTASGDFNAILFTQLGVSNRNELSSSYSVRGGNFDENLVYVNDIEVYRPFLVRSGQQEGLSFVNSDMVSSILFSAGGFEARYGDKLSSVLDIQYRRPRKFAGTVSGSFLGSNVHLEGVSKDFRFTWLMGARYKTNQYILGSLDVQGDYRPSFKDVQTFLTYDLSDKWELNFLGNYAQNKYLVVPQTRETEFGTVNQALRFTVFFDGQEVDEFETMLGALSLNHHPNEHTRLKFIASAFNSRESETFDILGQYFIDQLEADFGKEEFGEAVANLGVGGLLDHARNYLDALVYSGTHRGEIEKRNWHLLWGGKFQKEIINDRLNEWLLVDSAGFSLPQQPADKIQLQEVVRTDINLNSSRVSGYLQNIWNFKSKDTSEFTITAGVRANYWDLNKQTVVSPRATIAYKPNWRKDILFKFSSGYYYQPPFYRELRDLYGVIHPNLRAQQSIHFVAGTDINFKAWGRPFKFITEAYYKKLDNLIPYEIDNVRIRYYAENSGRGYAKGIDMKVNGEFVKGIDSWASISVMQTEEDIINDYYYDYFNSDGEKIISGFTFNDTPTDSVRYEPGFIPRPTDQRVNFGLFFQDYLPKLPDFKMHLNMLFGTSLPFGPPSFERYKDTLKMPPYRRVDIGFSYQILKENNKLPEKHPLKHFKSMWLSLEVFNLLQVNNTISYIWIRDVNARLYAIPNYLTNRQLNLRLIVKF